MIFSYYYDGTGGTPGGVRIGTNARFTMTGGEISGNSATDLGASGVSINPTSTFSVGGTATINGNTNPSSYTYPENIKFFGNGTFTDSRSSFTITNTPYYLLSGLNNSYALDVYNGTVGNNTNVQLYTKQNANRDKQYSASVANTPLNNLYVGKVNFFNVSAIFECAAAKSGYFLTVEFYRNGHNF